MSRNMPRRKGFALILVLGAIAITTTLGLSYLQKVSIGTSATATRFAAMQADYLAEAAVNHALWRILNDPGFPASQTVYYMHDLGNGRYGYKVRPPTLTTFATVAAVGAVGDVVAKQSYVQYIKPYETIAVYEVFGVGNFPAYRKLLGATFVGAVDAIDIGPNDARYVVLKGNPQKKEAIIGTLDEANDINLAVWDGTAWGNLTEFTADTGAFVESFDIAYETLSGHALVVGRYDDAQSTRYNLWDGNAWAFATAQEDPALQTVSNITYIDMDSNPNSDEILIARVDLTNDIQVIQWDGSGFNDKGMQDNDMATDDYGSLEVVYEQQSGDALVLWNHKGTDCLYYAIWDGAALSAPAQQFPDVGNVPYVIKAAADPASDYIFVGVVDRFLDLNVAVWDGDAWIDSREIELQVNFNYGQVFDIAWEHSGSEVVIAWATGNGPNVLYFTWEKGTALTDHAVQTGPNCQTYQKNVRLSPIPGTEKIVMLAKNTSEELVYSLWIGNTFLGDPAIVLELNAMSTNKPFDIAEPGSAYTGGAG